MLLYDTHILLFFSRLVHMSTLQSMLTVEAGNGMQSEVATSIQQEVPTSRASIY